MRLRSDMEGPYNIFTLAITTCRGGVWDRGGVVGGGGEDLPTVRALSCRRAVACIYHITHSNGSKIKGAADETWIRRIMPIILNTSAETNLMY